MDTAFSEAQYGEGQNFNAESAAGLRPPRRLSGKNGDPVVPADSGKQFRQARFQGVPGGARWRSCTFQRRDVQYGPAQ